LKGTRRQLRDPTRLAERPIGEMSMRQNTIDFPGPRKSHGASAKRYLVTGGCGFIGSHLTDRLVALGHEVRILDDLSSGSHVNFAPQVETIIGDVRDERLVRDTMSGVDGCFHLAAVASVARCNEDPIATHGTNLTGTLNVLCAAAEADASRVVYASSAAVYGATAAMPLGEASTTAPLSIYGADKLACELHARVASHLHGLSTVGLRLFNIYGARQDAASPYAGVISIFADRIRRRLPITIHGDGEQVRDFVYVEDAVDMLVAAMVEDRRGAILCNLCTGHGTSILALANLLSDILHQEIRITFAPQRACDLRVSIGDPRRAAEIYGVVADTRLSDGLSRLMGTLDPAAAFGFAPEMHIGEANP
jgi:UDP-glucose 4-epimerase